MFDFSASYSRPTRTFDGEGTTISPGPLQDLMCDPILGEDGEMRIHVPLDSDLQKGDIVLLPYTTSF